MFRYKNTTTVGFTLVEMIIVIAINTLLLLAIMDGVSQLYRYNSYSSEQANEVDAARRGVAVWVQDAREMTFAADGAFPVVRLENNKMGFYSDIDKDSSVEYVEYVLATTTLYKFTYEATGTPVVYSTTTPSRTEILSQFVQNLSQGTSTFMYYDKSGVVLASPSAMLSDVRYISLKIIVNIDPIRSPGEFMLQGSAAPRNLKDNT